MKEAERERSHRSRLAQIDQVQLVVGSADRLQVDHEGTLLERARMFAEELASHAATERGLAAFDRLLKLAQDKSSPHACDATTFLRAIWNSEPLLLHALRVPDRCVGDDMLAVLDAWRYARCSLVEHVEGGPRRVARVLK